MVLQFLPLLTTLRYAVLASGPADDMLCSISRSERLEAMAMAQGNTECPAWVMLTLEQNEPRIGPRHLDGVPHAEFT